MRNKYSKTIVDYLPYVYAKFPFLAQSDIDKIIYFGWGAIEKMFTKDVSFIFSSEDFYFSNFKAKYLHNVVKFALYYRKVLSKKIGFLCKWRKFKYDGYYYFYLTEKQYEEFVKENGTTFKKRAKPFIFRNLRMFKYKEQCWARSYPSKRIFRYSIPEGIEMKDVVYQKEFKSSFVELIFCPKNRRMFTNIRYSYHDYAIKNYRANEKRNR